MRFVKQKTWCDIIDIMTFIGPKCISEAIYFAEQVGSFVGFLRHHCTALGGSLQNSSRNAGCASSAPGRRERDSCCNMLQLNSSLVSLHCQQCQCFIQRAFEFGKENRIDDLISVVKLILLGENFCKPCRCGSGTNISAGIQASVDLIRKIAKQDALHVKHRMDMNGLLNGI